jgi:hypothetical protein
MDPHHSNGRFSVGTIWIVTSGSLCLALCGGSFVETIDNTQAQGNKERLRKYREYDNK